MRKFASLMLAAGLLLVGYGKIEAQNRGILSGQDTSRRVIITAVPFLLIAPDARSGAMGDAGAAISPDANSQHWNPAKLAFIEDDLGFALSYTPWMGNIAPDISISYLSGYYKLSRVDAVGVSLRYFDLGSIQETDIFGSPGRLINPREFSLDLTYSRLLTENLSLGGGVRYMYSNITGNLSSQGNTGGTRPANGVGVDLGLYYEKELLLSGRNAELALAGVFTNIGPKVTYSSAENRDFIPTNMRLGGAFTTYLDPYNSITFAMDLNKLMVPSTPVYEFDDTGAPVLDPDGNLVVARGQDPNRPLISGMFGSFADAPDGFSEELQEVMISLAAEYWYQDLFALRGGYFYEHVNKGNRKFFTLGAGIRYQIFGLDFAYLIPQQQQHPLSETLRFTLHFNFDNITDNNE